MIETLKAFFVQHPRLAAWILLAIGMVAILLFSAGGKGLTAGQLAGLAAACVLLAGVCVWIIFWE